jgi:uncharacterized protein YndB with AHSA1/START domain
MIRRQVIMPVSPERLWEALTDPDKMAGWFGAEVQWTLEEGAPARFVSDDGSERAGRVQAVRPGRHLRFRWWPTTERAEGSETPDPEAPAASEVSYLLEPVPEGTRLTIQERPVGAPAGFARAGGTPASGPAAGPRASWTAWDSRLAHAWGSLLAPVCDRVRA